MLNDDEIKTLINCFVKIGMKCNFAGEGLEIALIRGEDCWDLKTVEPKSPELRSAELHFKFPENLPDDNLDAAIELAGFLSVRLHRYVNNKKANAGKSPEQRKAVARKAVEARWAKYRAEKGKEKPDSSIDN